MSRDPARFQFFFTLECLNGQCKEDEPWPWTPAAQHNSRSSGMTSFGVHMGCGLFAVLLPLVASAKEGLLLRPLGSAQVLLEPATARPGLGACRGLSRLVLWSGGTEAAEAKSTPGGHKPRNQQFLIESYRETTSQTQACLAPKSPAEETRTCSTRALSVFLFLL